MNLDIAVYKKGRLSRAHNSNNVLILGIIVNEKKSKFNY